MQNRTRTNIQPFESTPLQLSQRPTYRAERFVLLSTFWLIRHVFFLFIRQTWKIPSSFSPACALCRIIYFTQWNSFSGGERGLRTISKHSTITRRRTLLYGGTEEGRDIEGKAHQEAEERRFYQPEISGKPWKLSWDSSKCCELLESLRDVFASSPPQVSIDASLSAFWRQLTEDFFLLPC